MKVVLISGSPHANGNTVYALNACAEVLRAEGLEAKVISLAGKKIESCVACGSCAKTGVCALRDDFNPINEEIKTADGLIVGAPVYFGTARGDMLSLLQRCGMISRSGGNYLAGKVGGPIAVARRGGLTATLQELLMFFFICGMTVPGSNYWNIVFGHKPGEAAEDAEGIKTVQVFAANVARLIKLQAK